MWIFKCSQKPLNKQKQRLIWTPEFFRKCAVKSQRMTIFNKNYFTHFGRFWSNKVLSSNLIGSIQDDKNTPLTEFNDRMSGCNHDVITNYRINIERMWPNQLLNIETPDHYCNCKTKQTQPFYLFSSWMTYSAHLCIGFNTTSSVIMTCGRNITP